MKDCEKLKVEMPVVVFCLCEYKKTLELVSFFHSHHLHFSKIPCTDRSSRGWCFENFAYSSFDSSLV